MDPRIKNSLETLSHEASTHEEPLFVVGGTLRDALIGREYHDMDLACPNARKWAEGFAHTNHSKCITLHGEPGEEVYRVPLGNKFFCDFGTLQGGNIKEDLSCRDFTLNAMALPLGQYLSGTGQIIDPFNGREDIENQVIRMLPGSPFKDDPLRMLRALRLAALLNFEIEQKTREEIQNQCELLKHTSGERVSQELLQLFGTSDPKISILVETGLLQTLKANAEILSERTELPDIIFQRWKRWREFGNFPLSQYRENYEIYFRDLENRALFCIASLLISIPEPGISQKSIVFKESSTARSFMEHYRFSNHQKDYVSRCTGLANLFIGQTLRSPITPPCPSHMFQWSNENGRYILPALLLTLLAHPEGDQPSEGLGNFLENLYDFYNNRFLPASKLEPLLTGNDLMETFKLTPSPLFKTILSKVDEARVLGDIQTREQAEHLTRKILENPSANG